MKKNTTLQEIRNHVELVSSLDISSKSRKEPFIVARILYTYFASKFTNECTSITGAVIERDHATILHMRKKDIQAELSRHEKYTQWYREIHYLITQEVLEDDTKKEIVPIVKMVRSNELLNKIYMALEDVDSGGLTEFYNTRVVPFIKMRASHIENKPIIDTRPTMHFKWRDKKNIPFRESKIWNDGV